MFRHWIYFLLLVSLVAPASSLPAQTSQIVIERNVVMKTRDGITLHADVYHQAGTQKYPVLLTRTPYDKENGAAFARAAAARGYLVVVQDVRGRYTSEGEWYPFKHEIQDGFDTVEWVSSLPNSNGKVGMFGGSYVGATQMLAAVSHPPHLAGICPIVTASNYHENWTYQGGAFEQWFDQSWTSGLAQDTLARSIKTATNAAVGSTVLPLTAYPLFNLTSPIASGGLSSTIAPYYLDWLAHPGYDDYWKQWSIEEQYPSIQVPALTVAAWYDIFQGGSIENYEGLKEHAGNDAARKGQRLFVTIGGHAGTGEKIGSVDFGAEAAQYDENALTLEWYDYLFQEAKNRFATNDRVTLFVMGENKWRSEEDWPLKQAKETRYFLRSDGKANTLTGDGSISTDKAKREAADAYIYDPLNPVPTTGGPLCCDGEHLAAGPRDQQQVEARPDVLVYTTPPLDQDLEATGPVSLELYAKSSAVDTDFTAKLVDVWPNGFAQNLTEGILRARYRESTKGPAKPIVPGQILEYKINMWSTSNVFLKGHKIRLEVSSSNFPRFDRNHNTGKEASTDDGTMKATNTVYHDAGDPSALVLSVVPAK